MKEKFINNYNYFCASTATSLAEIKTSVLNPSRKMKIAMAAVLSMMVLAGCMTTAFADGTGIFEQLHTMMGDIYTAILGLTTGIAVICIVIGALGAMISTNQQKSAAWIDFAKKAAIIWVIINVLGWIFTFLMNLTDGGKLESIDNM